MPPEVLPLIERIGVIVGPTGVLAIVLFYMWLKARRNSRSEEAPASSLADHDVLIEIRANVGNIKTDVAETKGDVKDLIRDSHTHPIP